VRSEDVYVAHDIYTALLSPGPSSIPASPSAA